MANQEIEQVYDRLDSTEHELRDMRELVSFLAE